MRARPLIPLVLRTEGTAPHWIELDAAAVALAFDELAGSLAPEAIDVLVRALERGECVFLPAELGAGLAVSAARRMPRESTEREA